MIGQEGLCRWALLFSTTYICVNSLVVGLPPCTFMGDYTNEHE
jgi:hypothetical protein